MAHDLINFSTIPEEFVPVVRQDIAEWFTVCIARANEIIAKNNFHNQTHGSHSNSLTRMTQLHAHTRKFSQRVSKSVTNLSNSSQVVSAVTCDVVLEPRVVEQALWSVVILVVENETALNAATGDMKGSRNLAVAVRWFEKVLGTVSAGMFEPRGLKTHSLKQV
eukprot:c19507_g1_i1.p1 GENE.c19507_g1_i1~~c19507_g1_i1.p1  ORF type:complete len:164 (-),score=40.72 c19507_g1_i1:135-626(-)